MLLIKERLILSCTLIFGSLVRDSVSYPASSSRESSSVNDNDYQVNRNYEKVKREVKNLGKSLEDTFKLPNIGKLFVESFTERKEFFGKCTLCRFIIGFSQSYVQSGATDNDVGRLVLNFCEFFKLAKETVCEGFAKLLKTEFRAALARPDLSATEYCGFFLEDCAMSENRLNNWTVPLTPKPPVVTPQPPKPGAPVSRVLHISDFHLDPFYMEGSNAKCGEPLCCRETSGRVENPEDAAGHFGDYGNCDLPRYTIENMLDHINKTHKLDYVIYTGDIPPHDTWNNSRVEVLYLLNEVCSIIQKYLGNIPIFPTLGNHESSPVNSFPIPEIKGNESVSWLYDEVDKVWSKWIPNQSMNIKFGAYYTALVNPGLRIVSVNMNYCNNLNFWQIINPVDPTEELAWLVAQLQLAEDRGEKVHIIGHIPPGNMDCLGHWSSNYYRIINRYENTVTAQFFAHTHRDEFEIFYDKTGPIPRPNNIAYIGPSATTYNGLNPGYRIYTVDGNYSDSSRVVLDHETYFTNLTESNLNRKLEWKFEYSAKDAYNMKSLLPEEWDRLVDRFSQDDDLFNKFLLFYRKMADAPDTDKKSKETYLCELRRGQSNDPYIC